METTQTRSFVRTVLPWIVAAAMLLLYFATRNTHVTAQSVWHFGRASGMDWREVYASPLTYLLTLPVRWFAPGWQLFALNMISMICAAGALGLLARSVAILPHDRTQLQREKRIDENGFLGIKLAWLPVIFAVLVAGLQLTFWEHAIVGTGEMIDLLLFAYCVRCLLEFRIEEKNSWLYRMAFVYGLGITNNFAMIAFFPAMLIALVWIKGLRFFRFNFLVTMFLLGLAGLSLYLLLPLVNLDGTNFWTSLKTNLSFQKQVVFGLRKAALLPTLCYAVPLILVGIRWASGFGDQSPIGSLFANLAAIILHAGILVFCVLVAFDLKFSPRQFAEQFRDSGIRFNYLLVYYLSALLVGYYSGFLLLVFSKSESRSRRRTSVPAALNYAVTAIVCAGVAAVAVALFARNYPTIRKANSSAIADYASEVAKSLPDKPTAVFSDDPALLYALHAALGDRGNHVLIEAVSLTKPDYHKHLQKRYGAKIPKVELFPGEAAISSPQNLQALMQLSSTHELVYIHPSFGYFFEEFYLTPHKMVHILKRYPEGSVLPPALPPETIKGQQAYWSSLQEGILKNLQPELEALPEGLRVRMETTPGYISVVYSRALNHWGVELQKAGNFDDAAPMFAQALVLNPNNAAALINSSANSLWRKEKRRLPKLTEQEEAKLGLYHGDVTFLFSACGPIDEPSFLTELANTFIQNTLYRQAQQMLMRGLDYVPDDPALRLSLANVHVSAQQPDLALARINEMRARPGWSGVSLAVRIEASHTEASALLAKDDFAAAEKLLKSLVQAHPSEPRAYFALSHLYSSYSTRLRDKGEVAEAAKQNTNALDVVEGLLQKQPTNTVAWFTCGNLSFQTGDYDRAVEAFSKVLQLTRQNKAALLNRAVSYFRSGTTLTNEARASRLHAAKSDYEDYKRQFGPDYRVYFGLGEIAFEGQDWRAAKDNFESYLEYGATAPAGERKLVQSRLDELKKKM